jgi:hypothetical protein
MDAEAGTIEVALTDAELKARRETWTPRPAAFGSGTLWKYAGAVGDAAKGAVTTTISSSRREIMIFLRFVGSREDGVETFTNMTVRDAWVKTVRHFALSTRPPGHFLFVVRTLSFLHHSKISSAETRSKTKRIFNAKM